MLAGLLLFAAGASASPGVNGWGANETAQLGTGSTEGPEDCSPGPFEFSCSKIPASASGLGTAQSLAGGSYHGLAVLDDGSLFAWGNNVSGQLGTGDSDGPETCTGNGGDYGCAAAPAQVMPAGSASAVAAGETFSLALLSDGTVKAWGSNYRSQLGDGTTEESDSPVLVNGLTEVEAIAAGATFGLALLEDGSVMAWGSNQFGELGDGTTTDRSTPVPVAGLTEDVVAIGAGPHHALAVLEGGKVVAWGANPEGELGNGEDSGPEDCAAEGGGTVPCSKSPVEVEGITTATSVAGGGMQGPGGYSLAVLENGTVKAWGGNEHGELGDNSTTPSSVPVSVSGISTAEAVAAGARSSYALLEDETVASWGSNNLAQLGDGSTEDSLTPVAVDGLVGVSTLGSGTLFALASGSVQPLPTVTGLNPNYGPPLGGTSVDISGSNFTNDATVKFGSTPALSVTFHTSSSITAVAPPGTGQVSVRVTTPNGISATGPASTYSYAPIVTSVSPNVGPPAGGTEVTITGGNFTAATEVNFGSVSAEDVFVNSDTSISATSPPGTEIVHVTVTSPAGTSEENENDRFGYGPIVEEVTPRGGPAAGGTEVTISGFGLSDVEGVSFGSVPAATFTEQDASTVTAVSPSFAGDSAAVPVIVTAHGEVSTTPDHASILPQNYFFYAPSVTAISPTQGPAAGGTTVTIQGTGFESVSGPDEIGEHVTAVYFGDEEAEEFTVDSAEQITAVSPPGTGAVDVSVETFSGTSPSTPADLFTYISPIVPGSGTGTVETPPGQITCAYVGSACGTSPIHCPKGKVKRHGKCVKPRRRCRHKHHPKPRLAAKGSRQSNPKSRSCRRRKH